MEYKVSRLAACDEQINQVCEKLLLQLKCDFIGLALQNTEGPNIKWHYAAGNSNDKYKRITLRFGKGIAGRVISTGRPMYIENFPEKILGKALEYPIMLAENILFAYAVPIFSNNIPKGVILAGNREKRAINEREQATVRETAKILEEKLNRLI
ncbi:GAF domain-containing protein [Cytobacillus sp. Hm23]|uniref:GAF domain-containing protein n=1 Tax=Cytobacillus sp. IB215665 TaxID=3097357 RepID=UPI002A13CB2C|nr:GAF domain-containing protein [Cytobacillus sp. IB215665]MDX8367114.1 GAF domain-containing protein [Cytobacillus sp. IB215665]